MVRVTLEEFLGKDNKVLLEEYHDNEAQYKLLFDCLYNMYFPNASVENKWIHSILITIPPYSFQIHVDLYLRTQVLISICPNPCNIVALRRNPRFRGFTMYLIYLEKNFRPVS